MRTTTLNLTSSAMKWALGGWSFFIAENYILSENRSYLIHNFGDDAYHIAYGSASSVAMISILYGYVKKVRNAPPFSSWSLASSGRPPIPSQMASFVCLSLGMGLVAQMPPEVRIPFHFVSEGDDDDNDEEEYKSEGNMNHHSGKSLLSAETTQSTINNNTTTVTQDEKVGSVVAGGGRWKVRCPFDFTDKRKADAESTTANDTVQLRGIERVTRHPGLWSFGLVGLGHGFLVPSLPQKAFLCMPAVVALVGGSHADSRHRRGLGGTLDKDYDELTSNIPFYAMLSRRHGNNDVVQLLQEFWVNEAKQTNAILAVGVSALWVLVKGRGVVVGAKMKFPTR